VVLACDIDAPRLQSFMADYGIPEGTASFAKVLARPEVEVVDICTPPLVNRDQILAALAAGKEVICEKPLVGSLRDLDAVTQAAARARGGIMPIFQYRYGDGFQKAKHLVDTGIAGKPTWPRSGQAGSAARTTTLCPGAAATTRNWAARCWPMPSIRMTCSAS
jgi:predicted dehydrogenase